MRKISLVAILLFVLHTNMHAQDFEEITTAVSSFAYSIETSQSVNADNFESFLKTKIFLPAEIGFVKIKTTTDELGITHYKYNQTYKNIEIFGAQIIVHVKNNVVYYINGKIANHIALNTSPTINEAEAIVMAKNILQYKKYSWENASLQKFLLAKNPKASYYPKPILSIIDVDASGSPTLCWQFVIANESISENFQVFIDANNGSLIKKINKNNTDVNCSGPTVYNGNRLFKGSFDPQSNNYIYLTESTHGPAQNQFIETLTMNYDPNFGNISSIYNATTTFTEDSAANNVHWGMDKTFNFYLSKFNRNSFDDLGSGISNLVHVENGYSNASWLGAIQGTGVMRYGDGDGIDNNPFVNLDVEGHELSHGVTEYSSGLLYEGESGALNESFSDMMAIGVEEYALGTSYNWLIGEGINKVGITHLRNLGNPKNAPSGQQQPDTYKGTFWINTTGCVPSSSNDQCGVHTNSGVSNYWFFLVAMGDTASNDKNYKYAFPGVGLSAALQIVYRMQVNYLTNTSSYADAVANSKQVAIDLFGINSIEYTIVKQAWCAVNLGTNCFSLGTDQLNKLENISIFPNPSNGLFVLENVNNNYDYNVTNALGAVIASGQISKTKNTIDLQNSGAGIYNLQLINNTNRINKKIIIR